MKHPAAIVGASPYICSHRDAHHILDSYLINRKQEYLSISRGHQELNDVAEGRIGTVDSGLQLAVRR